MDMIKAYAEKVASYLPKESRQETSDELYDSLIERYENEFDQTDGDAETNFLTQQPHPIKLATQLGENDKLYLIGPAFYLSFIETLKISAIIIAVIQLGLFGIDFLSDARLVQNIIQAGVGFLGMYLNAIVVIGLIFVALEKTGERAEWLDSWKVRDLATHQKDNKLSKAETLFELSISAIGLLWLTNVFELPVFIRHDGIWLTDIETNISSLLLGTILAMLVVDILAASYKLMRGYWTKPLRLFTITSNLVWIALLSLVVQQEPLISQLGFDGLANTDDLLAAINTGVDIAIIVGIVFVAWDTLMQSYRLVQSK